MRNAKNTVIVTASFIAAVSINSPAVAEGWQTDTWERHIKVTGSSPKEYKYLMHTLNTVDQTRPGLMFSCSTRHGLNIVYSFKGVDFMEVLRGGQSRRMRSIPVRLWANDKRHELDDYLVRRRDKVVSNTRSQQAAAAMRALLRDNPIRIKSFGYFDVTYNLPSLDAEAAKFLEVCPVADDIADSVKKESQKAEGKR
ncbi:hypothetical protein [Henriciella sp.]|uniref:hypothetical protein n=1 Tax=Henriciella sp. TaxID=1968823 RepID=UPI002626EC68|nr:hypothetical protein [Henriciella sp.]